MPFSMDSVVLTKGMLIATNFGVIIAINHTILKICNGNPMDNLKVGVKEIDMLTVTAKAFKLLLTILRFQI